MKTKMQKNDFRRLGVWAMGFVGVLWALLPTGAAAQYSYTGDWVLYQIHLGTYTESVDFKTFEAVNDLGQIRVASINPYVKDQISDTTRVFLGIYIGREAAEYALGQLHQRGYFQATLEWNDWEFYTAPGSTYHHAILVQDIESLDMCNYRHSHQDLYITKGDDQCFRVFSDVFSLEEVSPKDLQEMIDLAKKLGDDARLINFR